MNTIINKIKRFTLKSILLTLPIGGVGGGLISCSDYFDPSAKGTMSSEDNLSTQENQMYKNMIGIFNDIQNVGDQSIFLTDTRMNVLETTDKAPTALQEIYNYEETDGNEYADPTGYYKIIMSVNSFISNMAKLQNNPGAISVTGKTFFEPLISSAIRCKAWAYLMLGRIYGEAYWFDDPMEQMADLDDTSVFTHCDMQQLTEKALNLLNNGVTVNGKAIPATLTMDWYNWLDQENIDKTTYLRWQYLTPNYMLLKAEFMSWKCNYESEDAAKSDWLWIRNSLLEYIYKIHTAKYAYELEDLVVDGVSNSVPGFENLTTTKDSKNNDVTSPSNMGYVYQLNIPMQSDATHAYYNIFFADKNNLGDRYQVISSITYDFANNQTNDIVKYFCPTYPGDGFYLKPSSYAANNLYATTDLRSLTQKMVMNSLGGEEAVMTKYYYTYTTTTRSYKYREENIEEIQPTLIMFRGHDIHFLLAEAENHLGNWKLAQALLNGGLTNTFPQNPNAGSYTDQAWVNMIIDYQGLAAEITQQVRESKTPAAPVDSAKQYLDSLTTSYKWNYVLNRSKTIGNAWSPYYSTWFGSNGGYGNSGLAGTAKGDEYAQVTDNGDGTYTLNGSVINEMQRKEYIDWCLAQENAKEFVAEGKAYSYLCKMAERWSHGDRVSSTPVADKMADIICPKYQSSGKAAKVRSSLEGKYFIDWSLKGNK